MMEKILGTILGAALAIVTFITMPYLVVAMMIIAFSIVITENKY